MTRYLEISKHEMRTKQEAQNIFWIAFQEFRNKHPYSSGIWGDNIVIMWASDFHRLRQEAEVNTNKEKK